MLVELSIEVMWKFVEKKDLSKEEFKRRWRENYKGDMEKLDIVALGKAITNKKTAMVTEDTPEYNAIKALTGMRNKCIAHVRGGIDQTAYEELVKESQVQYKQLVGTDEQERIDRIASKEY